DSTTVTGFIFRRRVAVAGDATLPVFDFDSDEAFQPAIRNVTIGGLGDDHLLAAMGVRAPNGENVVLPLKVDSTTQMQRYYAIPTSHLEPADLQFLVGRTAVAVPGVVRRAWTYFHAPVDAVLTFAGNVVAPDVSVVASAPTVRLRARFERQSE